MRGKATNAIIGKGRAITERRIRAGYSVRAVADMAHVPPLSISYAERGRSVRPATAAAICAALLSALED